MKKLLSILTLLALLVPLAMYAKTIQASSNIVTREVKTASFSGVSTSTAIDIYFTQGNRQSVSVTAPDNVIDFVSIDVKDGVLAVSYKKSMNLRFNKGQNVKVYVTAPNVYRFYTSSSGDIKILSSLRVNGDVTFKITSAGDIDAKAVYCGSLNAETRSSGDIEVESLTCSNLNVKACSAGDVEIDKITANIVNAETSSSGDIELSGTCTSANYRSNSAGDIKAKNLIAVDVVANANSAGSITCTATGNAKTGKSSAGDVKVYQK